VPQPAWKLALFSTLAALSTDVVIAAKPAPVKDVTRQVEVIAGGRLRETSKGQGELTVSVWNKTKAAIAGPIFLIIDETGVESVKVGSHAEETTQGKPVFEIVSVEQKLLPGGMSKSLPVAFHIPEGLGREEADTLRLKTRVFGRVAPIDEATKAREQAEREDADFSTRGKSYSQADLDRLRDFQQQVSPELVKKPDVMGTAITENSKGDLALLIYTDTRAAAKTLPGTMGGYSVEVRAVPGGFKTGPSLTTVTKKDGVATSQKTRDAQKAGDTRQQSKGSKGSPKDPQLVIPADPQSRFDRPVPIGVSAFNADTTSGGTPLCATGTLGCRCIDSSGKVYGLSNAHVMSDFGFATLGETIIQPGQLDTGCVIDEVNNAIGNLVDTTRYRNIDTNSRFFDITSLPLNFIDAALMEVILAADPMGNPVVAVGVSTPSDGYGTPSSRVLHTPRLGLQVQKYGRTTGYTRGVTTAIDIYAPVGGPPDTTDNFRLDEVYGLEGFGSFSAGGDSGSLIVTLADRRPVSLLFAGSILSTVGNRIGPVLDRFNVRVDDGSNPNATTEGTGTSGLNGRGAVALGNITQEDVSALRLGATVNGVTTIISELLPPELRGRAKPNGRPLTPIHNGRFF
jgi:hypothetical protein